ncbi:hypothetical protein F4813DRAFT_383776 [Daldinia decipiens]|uniref:uncharacterized protein n=1 Tax=Daldinia decipiens TaxID=326647 RepID=UPI0020C391F7|nr:uncharacterized protein F4813DRAFT_383776 [Daldinia decipiens]KAI1652740.1 hypothetical protein F4813DRAFT_383776 [Daldinia decipiens]
MANQAHSLPVIRYRKGISAETFEKFLQKESQGVQEGVDDKLMLRLFGCSPWDLATWGLRFSSDDKTIMIRELNLLLPHLIWEGNVDILRYVLQKAIIHRLGEDIEPLGPLRPGIADILIAREKPDTPGLALEMWAESNPETNTNVIHLLELVLKYWGNSERKQWIPGPFVLNSDDILCIYESLDILSGGCLAPFAVQEYYDAFKMFAIKSRDGRLEEPDTRVGKERERYKTLAYWKSRNCNSWLKNLVAKNTAPYVFK